MRQEAAVRPPMPAPAIKILLAIKTSNSPRHVGPIDARLCKKMPRRHDTNFHRATRAIGSAPGVISPDRRGKRSRRIVLARPKPSGVNCRPKRCSGDGLPGSRRETMVTRFRADNVGSLLRPPELLA